MPETAAIATSTATAGTPVLDWVDPLTDRGWDDAVARLPESSFFHTASWARVLQESYGYRPRYLVRRTGARIHGVLPLMEVDSWLTGRRGVSLPFTDECQPLGVDAAGMAEWLEAARAWGTQRRWKYLELRGGRPHLSGAVASLSFYGHRFDLRGDEPTLLARIVKSARGAIKKAEQQPGLVVEFSRSEEAIRTFHQLACLTRKRHGVPPQPYRFFANIHRHVLAQGHGDVVLVRREGVPIAGAVFFHFAATALYKFAASDDQFKALGANNLILWNAIKHYARQGLHELDFGRTSFGNEGLRKFKLSWGTREYPIDYVRYDFAAKSFVTSTDESSGWHNRVFRALPSRMSQLIGTGLYKHIA